MKRSGGCVACVDRQGAVVHWQWYEGGCLHYQLGMVGNHQYSRQCAQKRVHMCDVVSG